MRKYEVRTYKFETFYGGKSIGVSEGVAVVVPHALRDSDGILFDYVVPISFETEEEAKKWAEEQK